MYNMTATVAKTPSILIVEDTESQATRLKASLEEGTNCTVQVAPSGEAGLEAAQRNQFDLIVLDIELPGIDGFEVCRRLKADESLAEIPVIMLTTRDRAEDALTGLSNGAVDYIPKDPFAELVLLETLKQMTF
jgi:putative two-component system response regulator